MGTERADDATIFRSAYPALRRFAAAVRAPGSDADDLVQEALARTLAVRSLTSLDDPLAYLRTAIVRVAINATRGERRAVRRWERSGSGGGDAVDNYPSDLDALRSLPLTARALLYLTAVEGAPYRDAARVVGCSEVAARKTVSRALAQLRREIGDTEPSET